MEDSLEEHNCESFNYLGEATKFLDENYRADTTTYQAFRTALQTTIYGAMEISDAIRLEVNLDHGAEDHELQLVDIVKHMDLREREEVRRSVQTARYLLLLEAGSSEPGGVLAIVS